MTTQFSGLNNRDFFIKRWEQEYPSFVEIIYALPPQKLEYRPHPRSRSAGELAALLVGLEQGCIDLCTTQRSSYSTNMRWHPPDRPATVDEMVTAYQEHHNKLAERLFSLDDFMWDHQAWMIRGDQEILLKDTVGGLLWLALFDAVHHRGQLSAYIRPMGGKVPGIYGPSADDSGT